MLTGPPATGQGPSKTFSPPTTEADIEHRFTNHPPIGATGVTLDGLTTLFIDVGKTLVRVLPEGREKALALTHLEQVSMWSKASVARNQ